MAITDYNGVTINPAVWAKILEKVAETQAQIIDMPVTDFPVTIEDSSIVQMVAQLLNTTPADARHTIRAFYGFLGRAIISALSGQYSALTLNALRETTSAIQAPPSDISTSDSKEGQAYISDRDTGLPISLGGNTEGWYDDTVVLSGDIPDPSQYYKIDMFGKGFRFVAYEGDGTTETVYTFQLGNLDTDGYYLKLYKETREPYIRTDILLLTDTGFVIDPMGTVDVSIGGVSSSDGGYITDQEMLGGALIKAGDIVAWTLPNKYVFSASDTAGIYVVGIATETVDNTTGADGDKFIKVWSGGAKRINLVGLSHLDKRTPVYVKTATSVTNESGTTNAIPCGVLLDYRISDNTGKVMM